MRGSCVIFSSNTDNGLNAGSFYLNANNGTSSYNLWNSCINGKFTLLALELGLNNKLLRGSRYES